MSFTFYMPTKVIMGKDCIEQNVDMFSDFGKNALIVTGKKSAKLSGALRDICNVLAKKQITYTIFDEVFSNPTINIVRKGAEKAKNKNVEFVIGIGGGSPLDAAKAIAILINNDLSDEDLFSSSELNNVLPLIAVPITAGTGSEVTPFAIITDSSTEKKKSIRSDKIFPKIAFLDEKYTHSLSTEITINTALDGLSHAIEGYLAKKSIMPSDLIAEECLKIYGLVLPELIQNNINKGMRELLLYASMLAGQVISQTGTTVVHAMGYYLTTHKKIDHGRANALIISEFLEFAKNEQIEKVNRIYMLMNLRNHELFVELINQLLGEKETITDEELKTFSQFVMQESHVQNTIPVPEIEVVEDIYKKSLW